MKTSLLLATILGLATAQNLSGQPACASPCLSSAITVAGCALSDQGCQCGTGKAGIQAAVATCLVAGCSVDDLLLAQRVGNDLCVAYSSTAMVLTIQTSTGPLSTTTTATTSLASTTGTSTSGGVSASGSSTTSGATTSPATTSPPSSSVSSSASAAAGTTSSSSAGAAQAGGMGAGVGGVVGLVLGLVAAL